jgi:hypothetical protein
MEEYKVQLPEENGKVITVTDEKSGLVVSFLSKNPIDVPNMTKAHFEDIARQMLEITHWWTTFDGDQLINLDFDEYT